MAQQEVQKAYYNQSNQQALSQAWWLEPQDTCYQNITSVIKNIETSQAYKREQNLKYARLYSGMELMGLTPQLYSKLNYVPQQNKLTLNVVKSCIDSVSSKIAKSKPKPMFLTEDGNYSQQTRARLLTQYVSGCYDRINLYEKAQRAFVDGCVFGTGGIKFFKDGGKVQAERVLIDEIIVDDYEGLYSEPKQLHQRKFVLREVLYQLFPKSKLAISAASLGSLPQSSYTADMVEVFESWHISKDPKQGKHVICVNSGTLLYEEYLEDYFPFIFFRWSPRLVGFYGCGIAEELLTLQIEINKTIRSISKAIELAAIPRIFIENSAMINPAHLTNEIGSIVRYTGTPPIFNTAQAMNSEVYNYLETLYRKAFEIVGISLLSATAQKPAGVNAAVAMREYQDIETERFMITAQRYEQFFLDCANMIINLSRQIFTEDKKLSEKTLVNKSAKEIKWSEVELDQENYIMKVFPVSLLPSSPRGQLQTIQEMTNAGYIDKDRALELLDFPDVEGFISGRVADIRQIKKMCELAIDNGTYMGIDDLLNPQLVIDIVKDQYFKGQINKIPEERLELLRRYLEEANDKIQAQQALQQPPPQMGMPQQLPQQQVPPNISQM